jgi:acyl-CoA dehydrogenase
VEPDFELPEEYAALKRRARELAASVAPLADKADERETLDPQIRARLAASGLTTLMVPEHFGGRPGSVDALAVTVVREALAAVSGHLDSMFAMQGIGSFALGLAGTDRLKEHWLPAAGRLDAIAALALTEPQVGSDLKALSTTIEQRGDELIVRGHKSFITNGGDADFYCVLGREGDEYSLVLIPSTSPGLSTVRPYQIIAPHVLADVILDRVAVPTDHRIGEPGQGFPLVLATLATFRVSVAGAAVGLADAALHEAVRHADTREGFGVPLTRLGSVPQQLALSWAELEMARALTYRAAAAARRDPQQNLYLSSLAKVGATEAAGRIVDRAVQVMGRFGLIRGTVIERLYREARPMRIYEGATEALCDVLSKQLVRRSRS